MLDLGYLAAFAGGALALLSPCSALLLPAFFAYASERSVQVIARTGLFYIGLVTTLVPLGVGSSLLSNLFLYRRDLVIDVAGSVIIVLGLVQIVGLGFSVKPAAEAVSKLQLRSTMSVVALGAMYGVAGFCSGPILGSVLTIAAASGRPAYGATLLAVYALGMTLPLLILAVVWDRFDIPQRRWLRGRKVCIRGRCTNSIALFSGLMFVTLGIAFILFDGSSGIPGLVSVSTEQRAQTWLQRRLPARLDLVVLPSALALAAALVGVSAYRRRATKGPSDVRPSPHSSRT